MMRRGQLRTHVAQQLHRLFDHRVGERHSLLGRYRPVSCHRRWHEVFIGGDPANLI